jgi:hypothetical protein
VFNRTSIELAQEEFGAIDREAVEEAKVKMGCWLSS